MSSRAELMRQLQKTIMSTTDNPADEMEQLGNAMIEVAKILKPLDPGEQRRTVRAVCISHGYDLEK